MKILGTDLVICGTDNDIPDDQSESFVLEQEIRRFDVETANDIHRRLVQFDLDHQYDVPIYEIFGHQVWHDGGSLHDHSPYSMELLIPLYHRIADEAVNMDRIIAIGVGGRYLDLLYDLAENEEMELIVKDQPSESKSDRSIRREALRWVPVVLFDMFCSLFLKLLFRNETASVFIVYPAFRPETFRPLERYLDIEYDGTIYLLTISYLLNYRSAFADDVPTVPIHCFESVRGFLAQCRFAAAFTRDLYRRETEQVMVDAVEDETGIRLDRTVGSLYHRAAAFNFAACFRYGTARRAFARSKYETLLLPSSDGLNKAIGLAGREAGVDVFVLPHTILHESVIAEIPYDHTRIVEGSITRESLQKTDKINAAEIGLPKHITIRDRAQSMEHDSKNKQMLVGTQPYDDGRRREFITDVVRAGLEMLDYEIVIKIHPAEDKKFYESTIASLDLMDGNQQRISITDSDLYQNSVNSDLIVTINSNVGIEAIILGTPTICYNKWSPDIRTPLYATVGAVPHIDNPEKLTKIFEKSSFSQLYHSQDNMVKENFMIWDNSLRMISEKIEERLRASIDPTTSEYEEPPVDSA